MNKITNTNALKILEKSRQQFEKACLCFEEAKKHYEIALEELMYIEETEIKIKKEKIIATNETLRAIIKQEIAKYGNHADLTHIDVSGVTDMSFLFINNAFNGDISSWDVSSVTNMELMFENSQFNQNISDWNVGNVTDMEYMFKRSQFNQDISSWNVSSVTSMYGMFQENKVFDQDLNAWESKLPWVVGCIDIIDGATKMTQAKLPPRLRKWR